MFAHDVISCDVSTVFSAFLNKENKYFNVSYEFKTYEK